MIKNKKNVSTPLQKVKITAAFVLLILMPAVTGYHLVEIWPDNHVQAETAESGSMNPSSDLENIGEGWWEANRLIYHGIPARIVFLISSDSTGRPDEINEAIWQEFDRIGEIFNPFAQDSEISLLNSSPSAESISVSGDIISVMRLSQKLWIETNGLFDPAMWQIKKLWQTAEKMQQIPTEIEIATALQQSGFDQVRIDETPQHSIKFIDHPVKFDFGGIIKGYAVDRARQILADSGVTAGLVQLGGEVCAFGSNRGANPWRIGIQHPKQMDRIWGVLSSKNSLRVSTSGNYRQPIRINNQSFYHIFSPKTGKPVSEKILGVTTVSIDGKVSNARLDGVATAITVMGAKNGRALAEKLEIDAVILYEQTDGTIKESITPGLANYYETREQN